MMTESTVWERAGLVLSLVGLVDSIYLTINVYFPIVQLYCPSDAWVDCGAVTSSPYSHILGVPVADMGLLWFVAAVALFAIRPRGYAYVVVILWVASLVVVSYLVYVEAGILGKVCLYCTLAHVCTILMGIPILKVAAREI